MPILIEKKMLLKKVAKVMLEFKENGVHAGKSDKILVYRKQAIIITLKEEKNLKNKPLCGKKKKIN